MKAMILYFMSDTHEVLARVILWFTKFCQAPWLSLPFASRNVRDSEHIFCMMICPDLGLIIIYLSTPTVTSWWRQWVVMAACCCYLWWRWWSDTLWGTLVRLRLHSLLGYLQIVIEESFMQVHGYLVLPEPTQHLFHKLICFFGVALCNHINICAWTMYVWRETSLFVTRKMWQELVGYISSALIFN
jgi:hypothetical protein